MNTRITNLMKYNTMIYDLNRHQLELNSYQKQIASGKKFDHLSEAPIEGTKRIYLRNRLGEIEQFTKNSIHSREQMQYIDSELGQTIDILQRVRQLTVQAANGTLQGDNHFELRAVIATEIEQHLQAILEIANRKNATGENIFAGHFTGEASFEITKGSIEFDSDRIIQDKIVGVRYMGNIGEKMQEIENGEYIPIDIPGQQGLLGYKYDD